MPDLNLTASTPLDGVRLDFANITIEEITDQALVSIAIPLAGTADLNGALQSAYGIELPVVGKCAITTTGNAVILGLAEDQHFIMFEDTGGDPTAIIHENVGEAAYVVDQSDSWVMIRVTGDNCRSALERICPLDLHPAVFTKGCVARTIMEHLSAIIICESDGRYILLSPSSSANSFLHALETSARNVTSTVGLTQHEA